MTSNKLDKKLNRLGARITYFPLEQKFLVFKDYKSIGEFQDTREQAAIEAIKILKGD